MTMPLMPKATAVWLVENTTLSFEQIADFCKLHPLEVQGIADGDVATGLIGQDPVASGQMEKEELEKAIKDPNYKMKMVSTMDKYITKQKKQKTRYTPVARRQDKPDAISWIVKHHPELTDAQIVKLVGTTKKTIEAVRGRTHWNISNLQPRDPVLLGVCTQTDLQAAINKARAAEERAKAAKEKEKAKTTKAKAKAAEAKQAKKKEEEKPQEEPAAEVAEVQPHPEEAENESQEGQENEQEKNQTQEASA